MIPFPRHSRRSGNAMPHCALPALPVLSVLLLMLALLLPRAGVATETASPNAIRLASTAKAASATSTVSTTNGTGVTGVTGVTGTMDVRPDAPLRVFILDQPPWSYLHDGQPYGAAVDVARTVLRHMGREVEFITMPFNRGLALLRQGKLDAVLAVYRTPEREQFLHYTTVPLYDEDVLLMAHPDDHSLAADTSGTARDAALYGEKPLALALGYSYGPTLDAIFARKGLVRTRTVYSLQEGVEALLRREVAAVPGAESTLKAVLDRLAPGRKPVLLRPPFDYVSAYLAFASSDANASLAAEFDSMLGRMRASGEYTRILAEADRILHAHQKQ
ncbi:MAG TPA: transporter substrate-binding domain-containing protein [Nitratidesulfovibrio sp.]|nr:transporter substrate-binding domain-containing protein [Nitratidesulfovibrio sp.]